MKTSPIMRIVITTIADHHGVDLSTPRNYFRLELSDKERVSVVVLEENLVSVAHYEQVGKRVDHLDTVFFMGSEDWVAIAQSTQHTYGFVEAATLSVDRKQLAQVDVNRQSKIAEAVEVIEVLLAMNLIENGWLNSVRFNTKPDRKLGDWPSLKKYYQKIDAESFAYDLNVKCNVVSKSKLRLECKDFHARIAVLMIQLGLSRKVFHDPPAGRKYLERLMVNYIRFGLTQIMMFDGQEFLYTNCADALKMVNGSVRFDAAYAVISEKMIEEIVKTYPFLKNECERQQGEYLVYSFDIFNRGD